MDRFFKLKENGTNVRTEIMAGITTFMTMAYILAVNPSILSASGLSWTAVFLATALAAGIFTIVMGLFVNFPVALAPGMGLNAYFAATIIASQSTDSPISPAMGLTAVFISGIIFLILTITQVRQMLIIAVPDSLKHAITVGIGLFIAALGLKNSGVMTISPETMVVHMGDLHTPSVYLTVIGMLLIAVLMVLRVPAAFLWGILGTTLIAWLTGNLDVKAAMTGQDWVPNFGELNFWHFDFAGIMNVGIVTVVLTFTFVELFDTFGTLVGTANRAGFMKNPEEGKKRVGKAMFVDAVGVSGGAILGTSTVTAFVESSSGIAQGGRTGLTAITTGVCFLLSLFLAPLVALIPGSATAAALILVGLLMMQSVKDIDFKDMVYAVPSFFIIVLMPFTFNIANGISFGVVSYVVLALIANVAGKSGTGTGKGKYAIHPLMWILAVLIVLRYLMLGAG